MNPVLKKLGWAALSLAGASALGVVALKRGEPISAIWIVIAAVCVYLIAYRFYSKFIAEKVMGLDAKRMTPAYKFNDGLDHVPTNKNVLFGHHFAAIAGAGPGGANGLPARHAVDFGWRGVCRRRAGLHGALHLHAPRWPLAR
jgi:carbon starvation protein